MTAYVFLEIESFFARRTHLGAGTKAEADAMAAAMRTDLYMVDKGGVVEV